MAKDLATIKDDPEKVRYAVLGYANSILLKGGLIAKKAALVIDAFSDSFMYIGAAGLNRACYEVVEGV